MIDLKNSRILITGAKGFLGSHLVDALKDAGINDLITFSSKNYNLTKEEQVSKLFDSYGDIDIVIHVAADVGGIGYSSKHPAKQFYNNAMMNTLVLHYAYKNKVKKFVGIGSVCEYPAETPIPFKEDNVWNGYPVPTNDAYGFTKRMLLAQSIAYDKEYSFNAIHLLPINLYGLGDDFSLENSHVIPALIRKFYESRLNGKDEVKVWGTGEVSREFVYVKDVAEAILLATERYNKVEPVNIGTGEEIKIKDLAYLIANLVGYSGEILFDKDKPSGQKRRKLDVSKAKKEFGFKAKTNLKEGLKKTIEWYKENRDKIK